MDPRPAGAPPGRPGVARAVACALATAGAVALAAPRPATAQPSDRPRLDSVGVRHVRGGVYAISLFGRFRMNVVASVGGDGVVLVDHQDAPIGDTIPALLSTLSTAPLRYLIITHWHPDHTGGNAAYGRRAAIIAHENVRRRVATRQTPSWSALGVAPLPPHAWPTLTFTDSIDLSANGERVVALHFGPAHTDGDAVVLFEGSGVAAVGDLFHGRGRPAGDDWYSGDAARVSEVLRALARRLPPDTRIVTGHGDVATVADLEEYASLYAALLAHVRAAGAAPPLPAHLVRDARRWGLDDATLIRLARIIDDGLKRRPRAAPAP